MNSKELTDLLNKDFGKDTVLTSVAKDVEVIPTGCIPLDQALGVGGIPTQRITEYYGGESSGKTTMALQAVANCQSMKRLAVYIDAEHALDVEYAMRLGVNMDDLVIIQPNDAETALNIIRDLFAKYSKSLGLVVLDSVAALIPKAERDSDVGDATVGLQARLLSSFVRRIQPLLTQSNAALLLINQQRATIGGMPGFGGQAKTTTGGMALRYAASVRVEFARTGNVDGKDEVSGIKVVANIKKNKVAPPYRKAEYEITFGQGTSINSQVINYGLKYGLVKRSGAWYIYDEKTRGQGMAKFVQEMKKTKELFILFDMVADTLEIPENTRKIYRDRMAVDLDNGENSDDN